MRSSCRAPFFAGEFFPFNGKWGRAVSRSLFFAFVFFTFLTSASVAAEKKAWTLLFYIAGDEESIDPWSRVPLKKLERLGSDARQWIVAHTDFHLDENGESSVSESARRFLIEKHPSTFTGHDFSTLGIASPELWSSGAETDSGAGKSLAEFLDWAIPRYPAEHYALFVLGHSWGWRGIGEDYNPAQALPASPGGTLVDYTMISIPEMRKALERHFSRSSPLDLLVLDACNDGVLEIAYEVRDLARAFSAAPTEMPFLSYDYARSIARPWKSGKELARHLVLDAVPTFGRGGSQSVEENEYSAVAITAVDLEKLQSFWPKWKDLLGRLSSTNFRELFLGPRAASWMDNSWNIDLAEFLVELAHQSNDRTVRVIAGDLYRDLEGVGHPPAFDDTWRAVSTAGADRVRIVLRADELLPPDRTVARVKETFDFMNPHLRAIEKTIVISGTAPLLWATVEMPWSGPQFRVKPYLPGGTEMKVIALAGEKILHTLELRHPNAVSVRSAYPPTSPYLANGHAFGTGRNHGLTLNLDEIADLTIPAHHHYADGAWVSGSALYRQLAFAVDFGWDKLLYGSRSASTGARPGYRNRRTHP